MNWSPRPEPSEGPRCVELDRGPLLPLPSADRLRRGIGGFTPNEPDRAPLERVIVETPPPERAKLRVMSGVEFLCGHSRLHAAYSPTMLERRIAPSLALGQFRYYTDPRGLPLAFCGWAWLNEQVLAETLADGRDLKADEFHCCDLPMFYEMLAPFGHCRAVVRDLRGMPVFKGRRIPAIRGEIRGDRPFRPRVQHFQF